MVFVGVEEMFVGHHLGGIARRLEDDGRDIELVEANMQDRVVEFARELERPEFRTERHHGLGGCGRRRIRPAQCNRGNSTTAVEVYGNRAIADAVRREGAVERRKFDALCAVAAAGSRSEFARARRNRLFELGARRDFIDQPPIKCAFSLHTLLGGAKKVGVIAPYFSLVGDTRQAAGARQHRKQWQFRQGDSRRAVIDQHDVVGCQCELVAAAGRRAIDRANGLQA